MPDGAKVTVLVRDVADAAADVMAVANSLRPMPYDDWIALGG